MTNIERGWLGWLDWAWELYCAGRLTMADYQEPVGKPDPRDELGGES